MAFGQFAPTKPTPHKLKDMIAKAQIIELDKPRKLMLTTLAWEHLELVYDSMAGALHGWAEMLSGKRQVYHVTRWLWALLQEELHQENLRRPEDKQVSITLDDVRSMLDFGQLRYYIARLSQTISTYYPVPDPQTPAAETESPGTGGGPTNSSRQSTTGTETGL